MTQNNTGRHTALASIFMMVPFVGITLFSSPIARSNPAPDNTAASATFRSKCVMCHGTDGAGSTVGKSMNVPDLRAAAVQKASDAQLTQIISDGKGGMPAFKNSLSEDQVHSLVGYIRSLQQKK